MKVCIVGGFREARQVHGSACARTRGYEVNVVCRSKSVEKLDDYKDRITIFPGATDDRDVIKRAVEGCDGVLVVLVPWGRSPLRVGNCAGRA